jgi:hypothetical protein
LNVAFLVAAVYVVCYVVMEPIAGSVGAILVSAIYLYSGHLVSGTNVLMLKICQKIKKFGIF